MSFYATSRRISSYTALQPARLSRTRLTPTLIPRDPPPAYDARHCNVIIFGETGTGKSSVVNLIAGQKLADTSSDATACTFKSSPYNVVLQSNQPICIWDTVGLNEAEITNESYLRAIKEAYQLIKELQRSGGVHLLLMCTRGRITATVQQNYRLFVNVLCEKRVPFGVVVTNLENEPHMEEWWTANKEVFERYGIFAHGHACITATPGIGNNFLDRYERSRETMRQLVLGLALSSDGWQKEKYTWFADLLGKMARMLPLRRGSRTYLTKRLRDKLTKECGFSKKDAADIATTIEAIRDQMGGSDQLG